MLARIGLSLFRAWGSIRKYVLMGDCDLFTKFKGSFRYFKVFLRSKLA
jgi:hypothetical protein